MSGLGPTAEINISDLTIFQFIFALADNILSQYSFLGQRSFSFNQLALQSTDLYTQIVQNIPFCG